jgi:hypothetical protein
MKPNRGDATVIAAIAIAVRIAAQRIMTSPSWFEVRS